MGTYPRYLVIKDNCSFFVRLQCHNEEPLLKEEWVKELLYKQIMKYKSHFDICIYGYRFMDNFADLIGKTNKKENLSKMISRVKSTLGAEFNRRTNRRGEFFTGKFKAKNIQPGIPLLKVMAHMDSIVHSLYKDGMPLEFMWTSYRYYASGEEDALIDPSPKYLALNLNKNERQKLYMKLIDEIIINNEANDIFKKAHFIGDQRWVNENYAPVKKWFREEKNIRKTTISAIRSRSELKLLT